MGSRAALHELTPLKEYSFSNATGVVLWVQASVRCPRSLERFSRDAAPETRDTLMKFFAAENRSAAMERFSPGRRAAEENATGIVQETQHNQRRISLPCEGWLTADLDNLSSS